MRAATPVPRRCARPSGWRSISTTRGVRILDGSFHLPGSGRDPRAEYAAGHIPGAAVLRHRRHLRPGEPRCRTCCRRRTCSPRRCGALGIGDGDRSSSTTSRAPAPRRASGGRSAPSAMTTSACSTAASPSGWPRACRSTDRAAARHAAPASRRGFDPSLVRSAGGRAVARSAMPATQIVDDRPAGRYRRPRSGTPAGAARRARPGQPSTCRSSPSSMPDAHGAWRPADELRGAVRRTPASISRGRSSPTAAPASPPAPSAFAAHLLGRDDVAVYDGSWAEWGNRDDTAGRGDEPDERRPRDVTGNAARARRPRPVRQSRRRQSARLSRLDHRLSDPRGARGSRSHALRGHPLRPPRHAHDLRAGRSGGGAGRRLSRHRRPLGTGGDHHQPAGLPEDRRPSADGRYHLRPGPPLLRHDAEGPRHRDHLLRSAGRPGAADPRRTPGSSIWRAPARSPSRCRTSAAPPPPRAPPAPSRSSTTPGAPGSTSARSGHGVDVSIQAATKYIVGHSDVMLGVITTNEERFLRVKRASSLLGSAAGPDDCYLALARPADARASASPATQQTALDDRPLAGGPAGGGRACSTLPCPPARATTSGGATSPAATACSRSSCKDVPKPALAAMLDGMRLFKMGFSWGGYESLIIPFDPRATRTATRWPHAGPLPAPALRPGERRRSARRSRRRLRQAERCPLSEGPRSGLPPARPAPWRRPGRVTAVTDSKSCWPYSRRIDRRYCRYR